MAEERVSSGKVQPTAIAGWCVMTEWQPIETAPKIDEKRILVVWLGHVQIASWNAKVSKWQEDCYGDFTVDDDEVTHWMYLPEPPK